MNKQPACCCSALRPGRGLDGLQVDQALIKGRVILIYGVGVPSLLPTAADCGGMQPARSLAGQRRVAALHAC
jgi:hypothetical protein